MVKNCSTLPLLLTLLLVVLSPTPAAGDGETALTPEGGVEEKICVKMKDVFKMPGRMEIHGRPRALPNLGGCTQIKLNAMRLGWEEMEELAAQGLETNVMLHTLILEDNEITSKGAEILAKALEKNTALRQLDLSHNHKGKITNEGAIALAHMLRHNTALKEMDLAWNYIKVEGGTALADALRVNKVLEVMTIDHNPLHAGVDALREVGNLDHHARWTRRDDAHDEL